jgi:hypothetical protein
MALFASLILLKGLRPQYRTHINFTSALTMLSVIYGAAKPRHKSLLLYFVV